MITPVIMSTEGLCCNDQCMPAALAIWARRANGLLTWDGAAIIKSASSSIIITICGRKRFSSPFFFTLLLKDSKSRTPFCKFFISVGHFCYSSNSGAAAALLGFRLPESANEGFHYNFQAQRSISTNFTSSALAL